MACAAASGARRSAEAPAQSLQTKGPLFGVSIGMNAPQSRIHYWQSRLLPGLNSPTPPQGVQLRPPRASGLPHRSGAAGRPEVHPGGTATTWCAANSPPSTRTDARRPKPAAGRVRSAGLPIAPSSWPAGCRSTPALFHQGLQSRPDLYQGFCPTAHAPGRPQPRRPAGEPVAWPCWANCSGSPPGATPWRIPAQVPARPSAGPAGRAPPPGTWPPCSGWIASPSCVSSRRRPA